MSNHYKDPYAPPLTPKLKTRKPSWAPSYREYNKRSDWWHDLDHKHELYRNGRDVIVYHGLREFDRFWFDPKVPDGTSLIGPFGLDSKHHKNLTMKADTPGNLREFQKKVRETSAQFKNIISKWDISEQHPGIAVNPTIYDLDKKTRNLGTVVHKTIYTYGPRFWDKPINEGCFEKGLALVKYTSALAFAFTILESAGYRGRGIRHNMSLFKPTEILKTWITKNVPTPAILSMTFGISACTAATIRDKDDCGNWNIASMVTGAAFMTMKNYSLTHGLIVALPLALASFIYHAYRLTFHGLQGLAPTRNITGFTPYSGPLTGKHFAMSDSSVNSPLMDRWNRLV